jgi:hypothetical protein
LLDITVCLSILEGFDQKKRVWTSPRGVGDGARGFPSPIEFFNRVGLMFIAVYKGLLISHSILEGVAQKKPVGSWTGCPRIGPLLFGRMVWSYFNQFLKVLTKEKRLDLPERRSGQCPRVPEPNSIF